MQTHYYTVQCAQYPPMAHADRFSCPPPVFILWTSFQKNINLQKFFKNIDYGYETCHLGSGSSFKTQDRNRIQRRNLRFGTYSEHGEKIVVVTISEIENFGQSRIRKKIKNIPQQDQTQLKNTIYTYSSECIFLYFDNILFYFVHMEYADDKF